MYYTLMFTRNIELFTSEDAWKAARATVVTSTDVAALFGVSPYSTEFELFHRKQAQLIVEGESNERLRWGKRLESVIAQGIADEKGWLIAPMSEFITLPDLKLGASFDFKILSGEPGSILEVKNVDSLAFKQGWLVEGDDVEAPPHIELQVQTQLLVSGLSRAFIGVLVGGNRPVVLERKTDSVVQKAIVARVARFWDRIKRNDPPKPDFARDSDFICSMYASVAEGKVVDLTGDTETIAILQRHKRVSAEIKALETEKDSLKAQLLAKVGDAQKAIGPGFSISLGIVKGGPVSYERKDYRQCRIIWAKETP